MKGAVTVVLVGVLALVGGAPAWAQPVQALVDAQWVQAHSGRPEVRFIDIQDPQSFQRFHLPGAVNAPYAEWRTDEQGSLPGMLPQVKDLETMLSRLGVTPDQHAVIVATGRDAGDMSAAARVFWTLKVLGHEKASILDGGLVAYAQTGGKLVSGRSDPSATSAYRAQPAPGIAPTAAVVKTSLDRRSEFVDARSEGEFVGIYTGDKAERPGTIPGSKHLPYDWVLEPGTAKLRDAASLRRLFEARGIAEEGEQVHFCHSGNRAALTWFAAYALLGNEDAKLYDGSMMEWARRADLPVEAAIDLCVEC